MNKNTIFSNIYNFRIMLIALIKGACNSNMKDCLVLSLDFLSKITKSDTTGIMIINLHGAMTSLNIASSYCKEDGCQIKEAIIMMCKSIDHLMKIAEISPNEPHSVKFMLSVINEGYSDSL